MIQKERCDLEKKDEAPLFSILIPTWNNLDYLKLCIESIRKNSTYKHQILIHVNDGSDGTQEWVKQNGFEYTQSATNVGICWALNLLRTKVKTDYILYMNDDMYVCPLWDKALYDEIRKANDKKFFFSSTLLQPRDNCGSCCISSAKYGNNPGEFDEQALLKDYMSYELPDWFGATSPPNIVHKDLWDLVGGYSIEFSPGMYSDPDFTAKLWMAGVRLFKGISQSRVYHFEARSTNRIERNKGQLQFLSKWGITSSSFRKNITKRGEVFLPWQLEQVHSLKLRKDIYRSHLKELLYLFQDRKVKRLWDEKNSIL